MDEQVAERYRPGSLVRCREREWVVLPSPDPELLLLRPLGGGEGELVGVYLPLARLGLERIEPAEFPLPSPHQAGDFVSAQLLWDAARLSLRDGAGPFRSLGRLSVRPRPYQYVPLLMALRLDPVRLLIADDVGIGKTIEGALIARELLDRGEAHRLCVLCPPYLTDQWQKELREKFHIEAEVIRSGTVARLERRLPPGDHSIFEYYPHIIVSIDYAKSERHKHSFLLHCPDLVIIDEAHSCARPAGQRRAQQQRYQLVRELSRRPERHLILLTATPHSGFEDSFLSLLGFLKPELEHLNLERLTEADRDMLARHFIQRRRADVQRWLDEETQFPERESTEVWYELSPEYKRLFRDVYGFAHELVRSGEASNLNKWRKRLRYWTALALLRCVMSSPAAARAALLARVKRLTELEAGAAPEEPEEYDTFVAPYIYDYDITQEESVVDVAPSQVIERGEDEFSDRERRQLRDFARRSEQLLHSPADTKLQKLIEVVEELLQEGYHPIIWCRYIATSDYVAEALRRQLGPRWPGLRVASVTGALPDDARQLIVEELGRSPRRVLVATDCLSEGINLQEHFTAVVHYDLPWNPNRLEQREGRVDRFGQPAKKVKAVLLYGRDNPIDGAVLDVLLRKARKIHRTLRIHVPVPINSETVMEAVLQALFFKAGKEPKQLSLFEEPVVKELHKRWDRDAEREKESRTRFAQRAIKPDEVRQELEETDKVLGDPGAVERFVRAACERLGNPLQQVSQDIWRVNLHRLPGPVRARLGDLPEEWRITFKSPPPEGVVYVGRNHPLIAGLAEYLLETALDIEARERPPAARAAVIRTGAVARRTTLLLLRLRFLMEEEGQETPMLAEEVLVRAFRGHPGTLEWLPEDEALELLAQARPVVNVSPQERQESLEEAISWLSTIKEDLSRILDERARRLEEAHRRVRRLTKEGRLRARPHHPPDVLGIYVLLPVPQGVVR